MKRTAIILAALALAACQPMQPAPRAYGVPYTYGTVTRGCRYSAYWGGPEVNWIDHTNGHRWTCSYRDFFRYCGGRHPNALGIAVHGKLPPEIANPQPQPAVQAQPAPVAQAVEAEYEVPNQ